MVRRRFSWPDGGTCAVPQREEPATGKALTAYHAPSAGRVSSSPGPSQRNLLCMRIWLPTLFAAAGGSKRQGGGCSKACRSASKTFKVHLDGYNKSPTRWGRQIFPVRAHEFFYFNDDGSLVGLRYEQWKIVFSRATRDRTSVCGREPFTPLALPRSSSTCASDPFETADPRGSMDYPRWRVEHASLMVPARAVRRAVPCDLQGVPAPARSRVASSIRRDHVEALQYGPKAAN